MQHQYVNVFIVFAEIKIILWFSFAAATKNMATTSASSVEFLEEIFHLMVQECLIEGSKPDNKVVEFLPPDKLKVDLYN